MHEREGGFFAGEVNITPLILLTCCLPATVAGCTTPSLPSTFVTDFDACGKMRALLCAAFAATASGFGSIPGELVRNPCANPDTYTPEAMLPGHCHGVETIGRDVCQTAGCDYSEDPQDAHDPCGCDTQGHLRRRRRCLDDTPVPHRGPRRPDHRWGVQRCVRCTDGGDSSRTPLLVGHGLLQRPGASVLRRR